MPESNERNCSEDPLATACQWQEEAWETEPADANAAALATADETGAPNVRMVLVKRLTPGSRGGAVFFTNLGSKKGQEIANNPQAALVLHWKTSERQLRFRGLLEPVSEKEADAYFATRPYRSRVGAWASRQSAPLASRALLIAEAARIAASYPTAPPRPSFWHGFLLRPLEIEFWNSGDFRLHDRFRWRRNTVDDSEWNVSRLHP